MAEDELLKQAAAYRKARILNSVKRRDEYTLASAGKSSLNSKGGSSAVAQVLADASKYANRGVNTSSTEAPKDFWEGAKETLGHIAETPVIKQIIDTISTPLYAAANIADYSTATEQHNRDKLRASIESGSVPSAALDLMGMQGGQMAQAAGIFKGISGGIGANRNDDNTFANTVSNLQERAGIDTQSPESKAVQGWAGFGADVLLDPVNVIPLAPAVKFAKGASRGSKEFASAKALTRKTGEAIPEHIQPTRWENAKAEGAKEIAKYRKDQFDIQQAAIAKKSINKQAKLMKGSPDNVKAKYLIENINTLRPAVKRALKDSMDNPVEAILDAAIKMDTPVAKVEEIVNKVDNPVTEAAETAADDLTTDSIMDAIDEVPDVAGPERIGLSKFKQPTTAERLFDLIGQFRTVDKKPIYGADVIKNVNDMVKARTKTIKTEVPSVVPKVVDDAPAAKVAENGIDEVSDIPDLTKTFQKLREFNKKMDGTYTIAVKGPNGKNVYVPVEDFIDVLKEAPRTPKGTKVWNDHLNVLKESGDLVYKSLKPKSRPATPTKDLNGGGIQIKEEVIPGHTKLSDNDLKVLGVKPEHWDDVRKGKLIEEFVDETSVGDIAKITRDIRSGVIGADALKPFYDYIGSSDPKKIAKYIDATAKTPAFQEAGKNMAQYGTKRTGETVNPAGGISGHGLLSRESKDFTADDILASKTPSSPEEARAFLEAVYEQSANALASHKDGAKLRVLADKIFEETIDVQRRPAGPLKAKGGASVASDLKSAKYETRHNTHSAMYRVIRITEELRKEYRTVGRNKYDEAFMLTLRDVDNRLRLAGFDPHLSNMQMTGDKLVVRLAPSDVFGAMTMSDRIKFIHGAIAYKPAINEFMPTTVMDLAEVLVRSATRLKPDGTVDMDALINNAMATLQGKYQGTGNGTRVIKNNLDVQTWNKNQAEILREVDIANAKKTNFYEQFMVKGLSPADKNAVIETAMNTYSDAYKVAAEKRLTKVTNDLITVFTRKFADGKPSKLSDLINTNMRNASVMGGNVAREIGEASAEYSQKVLDALDSGTSGEFLSELVSKPPFKATDPASAAIIKENREAVRNSVASPEELRHIDAANKNVELSVAGSRTAEQVADAMRKLKADKAKGRKGGVKTATNPAIKERQKQANKNNKDAYQKDPEVTAEMAKPTKDINTEKVFDLLVRERNKDLLYRSFGLSRFFNKRTGMNLTFDAITSSAHATPLLMTGFHGILRDLRRKGYSKEQLRVAFNEIKAGSPASPIAAELNAVLSTMFDPSKVNFLTKNSIGPKHFNDVLKSVGFDEAKVFVPEDATPYEMMNAWKSWEVNDVEDFFSKMMGAMVKASDEVSMGASFSKHFGSATPEPGYVKIIDTSNAEFKNEFFPLIDQSLYYPKEVAHEFVHIGRLMTESRAFKPGTKTHTFVTKIMDPIVSNLKMTQTTMKPGHHIMSVIGDGWRNNLALTTIGVANPARQVALYGESARILWSVVGQIDELSSFQQFQRLQGLTNELKVGKAGGNTGSEFYPNIKDGGRISHADMYALMQANGVALPAHLGGMAEDYLTDFADASFSSASSSKIINGIAKTTEGLDRLMNPIKPKFGMKNPYSINKFTANRDTWTRGVLFLGAMRSRKFHSIEEAVQYSANFVKKWSPTALDLGGFEAKYARRSIFYYTWLRGMVPRIIESALMTPGVALIPNKAMYNMGLANGIDLNSIGDPFPDDQLFPDWYTQRVLGPQYKAGGDLWGFNPTGPLSDVLNSLGSNVKPKDFLGLDATSKTLGTFANMSTPWVKAPAEALVLRKQLQSGAPIEDPLQYLQDMIGPARTLSKATGKDLYPAMGTDGIVAPNRSESKYRNGMTQEETVKNALPELLNWASGLQFTNYTSDEATKSAEFQKKQKLIDQRKRQERLGQ